MTETRTLIRRWSCGLMRVMSASLEAAVQPPADTAVGDALRRLGRRARGQGAGRSAIVAATQVVLQEHVEHDEQVAAAHLVELELRGAGGAVGPRGRHD